MATVQNVIFDLGGVLLDWNPGKILERCYADTASRNAVRDALFRHEDWQCGAMRARLGDLAFIYDRSGWMNVQVEV
jgi:FMN phosphatase YigB (HAD superfamily)